MSLLSTVSPSLRIATLSATVFSFSSQRRTVPDEQAPTRTSFEPHNKKTTQTWTNTGWDERNVQAYRMTHHVNTHKAQGLKKRKQKKKKNKKN
jgi:hypothetical protein